MGKSFRIFFSWQSNVGHHDNRTYIRKKIESVIKKFHKDYNMTSDEATRDTAGSPDIVSSIMSKIGVADIFICDLSIIKDEGFNGRGMPNSNVMFELGIAVAHLGWERIICVVNTHFGNIEMLPFDINHQRCLTYCKDGGKEEKKLNLYDPILKILSDYDEIVARFCKNDHILHDKTLFEILMGKYSEEELVNSLNNCRLSRTYNEYDYKLWEYFSYFQNYPKNSFIIDELNTSYKKFTIAIDAMITAFITLFNRFEFGWEFEEPEQEYTQEDRERILRSQRYKMREPNYSDNPQKLKEYYETINNSISQIDFHCNNVINSFKEFRNAVSRLLFV